MEQKLFFLIYDDKVHRKIYFQSNNTVLTGINNFNQIMINVPEIFSFNIWWSSQEDDVLSMNHVPCYRNVPLWSNDDK